MIAVSAPRTRPLTPIGMSLSDLFRVGGVGLRARPRRVILSAIGIAIGIAAMIAVIGISSSSREEFNRQIAALGTNLLTVSPGQNLFGEAAHLPTEAVPMIERITPVESVAATGSVSGVMVYRNDLVPPTESGGIAVLATNTDLLATIGGTLQSGAFLNDATATYPAVVLGATAADRLGVGSVGPEQQVYLGDQWFTVVGILEPVPLAPEIDTAALIGWPIATDLFNFDGYPTTIYTRTDQTSVEAVQSILASTANPAAPHEVDVSRPSDALAAQHAADDALNGLLLGLGSVSLLVGGIGIANTMIISVLERRGEIGLRRALGATRRDIRGQFLTEAILLSALGGLGGVILGVGVTAIWSLAQTWPIVVPTWAMTAGFGVTLLLGAAAGLYPAMRAANLSPTAALSIA